jgi:hypothetical protein
MAGARDEKHIADKYSLDYHRRPLATRVWKSRWNWFALLAAAAVVLLLFVWRGNSAFWAGPVSDVHASFAMDCGKCHTESWQPALRLASIDSGRHSVPNAACQQCHHAGEHHPRTGEKEISCAACHQEHRPDLRLTALTDPQCVRCHGDLTQGGADPLNFVSEIRSFADHPEFAVLRTDGTPPGENHRVWQVAAAGVEGQPLVDRGGLLFNHQVHLAPAGVLNSRRETVHLACSDCHVAQADGRYMTPLNYKQHCAECHPLRVEKLGELPHEAPELVLGALRERIARLQLESAAEPPVPESRDGQPLLRLLPKPVELTELQAKSAAQMLAQADHTVFGLEAKGFCRQCHKVEIRNGVWHIAPGEPASAGGSAPGEPASAGGSAAMTPQRWLTHAKFHHEKHRTITCTECHAATASSNTSDVLLPSIATCRKCHGTSVATIGATIASDCVTCHEYHAPTHGGGGVELDKLLTLLRQ